MKSRTSGLHAVLFPKAASSIIVKRLLSDDKTTKTTDFYEPHIRTRLAWRFIQVMEEITDVVCKLIVINPHPEDEHPEAEAIINIAKELKIPITYISPEDLSTEPLELWLESANFAMIAERIEWAMLRMNGSQESEPTKYILDTTTTSPKVDWLIPRLLPRGTSILMAAREGTGKSTIALTLAAELATNDLGKTLILAAEHYVDIKRKKQKFFPNLCDHMPILAYEDGNHDFRLINATHMATLDQALQDNQDIQLIVLDCLRASLAGLKGVENSQEAGNYIRALNNLVCEKHSRTLLIIHHFNKARGVAKEDQTSGTTDIRGAVRLEIQVKPISFAVRRLDITKDNLGADYGNYFVALLGNIPVLYCDDGTWAIEPEDSKTNKIEKFIMNHIGKKGWIYAREAFEYANSINADDRLARRIKDQLGLKGQYTSDERYMWIAPKPLLLAIQKRLSNRCPTCPPPNQTTDFPDQNRRTPILSPCPAEDQADKEDISDTKDTGHIRDKIEEEFPF